MSGIVDTWQSMYPRTHADAVFLIILSETHGGLAYSTCTVCMYVHAGMYNIGTCTVEKEYISHERLAITYSKVIP